MTKKALIAVVFLVAGTALMLKGGANYVGLCTDGVRVWRWRPATVAELQAFLAENAKSNMGVISRYSVVPEWAAPGDEYRPATFLEKITGKKHFLIKYENPWLAQKPNIISTGYFYAPNCVNDWTPPA
jgi:hypothetical protein